ncbi:methyltransferase family protein [Nitrosomonas marina]|uniref:Protein-S-isoprenylcysteine O-methyltransferase Ste14 n=1 Tax=Nitrosomonas marina TaxID=917 RepID=A0A1H8D6F2_9PROT|nr:DUF1295 domain-containing protein [Nitrosomonas marina]SEN02725.1 Protein of unknown function [Nitrosomonas marina]
MPIISTYSYNFSQRVKNLSATLLIIAATSGFYAIIPYYQSYFSVPTHYFGKDYMHWQVLVVTTLFYTFTLFVFYLTEPAPRVSKSIYCLRALHKIATSPATVWKTGLPFDERLGLLSILLKAFFAPLMIVWLFSHTGHMLEHGNQLLQTIGDHNIGWLALFNTSGFWFVFKLILFLDVLFFTIGYLVELPSLNNEIRSVDPTLLGWAVALASYPPFNGLTSMLFGGYFTDFPQFSDPAVHVIMNVTLLILMAIYTSASVALNFKASNLTHRGIIMHGPYRYIRHPAYVCKNLAWWIGLMPAVAVAWQTSLTATLVTIGSMVGWSMIYIMRALTEERHLRSIDSEYDQYCASVKYRFIPGLV